MLGLASKARFGSKQHGRAVDASKAIALLRSGNAESIEKLKDTYVAQYGRDLEYDLRGFSPTIKGLKGAELKEAFAALHGPRLEANATRIAELTGAQRASTTEGRAEIYGMLAQAGGEERTLLCEIYEKKTGKSLTDALRPVTEASAANEAPITSDPDKTVAIIVSSGNWKKVLDGQTDQHVGGYHWREIEAYVQEALDRGFTPVLFTPDGLPPSPDALSLLQGKLGPKVGFGTAAGHGPDSPHGKVIVDGMATPHSLKNFDATKFATVHIAGGHGSNQDLVGHPLVESAATKMHERGRVVTAVCHATPALGSLLKGGNATGFSPQLDALNVRAGTVLPEFDPPYDAHQGLRDIGAKLNLVDSVQAFANLNHKEVFEKDGVPIVTGTGPEATDDVARFALDWLAKLQK